MFTGCLTALITPFKNQQLDEHALRRLVNEQIKSGVHGLVPLGTTGESPTLSDAEYERVLQIVVEETNARVPVIAGVGSNNPYHSLHLAQRAQALGANAILAVAGYYNRPSQAGLYEHFKMLHDASDLPIIIYNIPPRTIVDIQPETMAQLAELDRVVGVKDATGNLARISDERLLIKRDFTYLSGDDSTALAYNIQGGVGCISVLANILPAQCVALQNACANGNWQQAKIIHEQLYPLVRTLFIEPNPAGIKYAAECLGLCSAETRLPMVPLQKTTKVLIEQALKTLTSHPTHQTHHHAPHSLANFDNQNATTHAGVR